MKLLNVLLVCSFAFVTSVAYAGDGSTKPVIVRPNFVATTTDWEALTGLYLSKFDLTFKGDKALIGNGLELYYLDSFPCSGQRDSVRVWIGPGNKTDGEIRLACLTQPKTINFAWRNVSSDAIQGRTTGILECPISENSSTIDLSKCIKGKNWQDQK